MAYLALYAGTSTPLTVASNLLPSPVSLKTSVEQIWSEDTGRAQSGSSQAKMIGTSITQKRTYEIQWGIITSTEYSKILSLMPRGFFYFGVGNETTPPGAPGKYYRGTVSGEMLSVGGLTYYKGVSVSLIEQ